jgi:hypothetical protein
MYLVIIVCNEEVIIMATAFTFSLENKPGQLAVLAEIFGKASVNIEGGAALCCPKSCDAGGEGRSHATVSMVAENPAAAITALDAAGMKYDKEDVLVVSLKNDPGTLADFSKALAGAGVNLNSFYILMDSRIVFGADDIPTATKVAKEFGAL